MKPIVKLFLALFILCITGHSFAATFEIKKIQVNGLHRISEGTVLNYLPVQVGDTISDQDTPKIIKALYKTSFFSDISLGHSENTLIIDVKERPTIGSVVIKGNKLIATKDLTAALNSLNVGVGQVYDQSVIDSVQRSLQREYFEQGNYSAKIQAKATQESGNRIALLITIEEGNAAKIKKIKIIGNKVFDESTLVGEFKLNSTKPWDFLMKGDQYSSQKLEGDIEKLKSFYMDRGYLKFTVDSTQVVLSPQKTDVDIIIHVTEGSQYKLKNFNFDGKLIYPEKDLRGVVVLKPGQIFSRQQVNNNAMRLSTYYGMFGYAFAKVQPIPHVDEATKEVTITYLIDPGKKVYVRRISFEGNTKTKDTVIRRELRQQEGALANQAKIKDSERRLNNLGYFKTVNVQTLRVPGTDDAVDLAVKVSEAASATLTAGAGYSDTNGILLNAGFNQPNFFGTGKNLGINFNTSSYQRYYNVSYYNPYYTESGIGRGLNIYAQTTDTDSAKVDISTYATDTYGASMTYSFPLSDTNNFSFGYGYDFTRVKLGHNPSYELINYFNDTNSLPPPSLILEHQEETFKNVMLTFGWNHIDYDRGIFPTRGFANSVSLEIDAPGGGEVLSFYKLNYLAHYFHPLGRGFIASLRVEAAYGGNIINSRPYPFWENYYAGGIGVQGNVRGYDGYSIGPKDSHGNTYGGNSLIDGTIALIIPTPIAADSVRTSVFVDFGNVYNTTGIKTTTGSGPVRLSAGIAAEWRSPIGPLIISLAEPLNSQPGDDHEVFQFTVGTSF